jgi:hypothetical protein
MFRENRTRPFFLMLATLGALGLSACKQPRELSSDEDSDTPAAQGDFIYVASGACYAGGATTLAGVQTITRFSLSSGLYERTVADYFRLSGVTTEMPNAIAGYSDTKLIVGVETGATTRRLDLVDTAGNAVQTYLSNATAFNQVLRHVFMMTDGSVLVSKGATPPAGTTGAIEKFNSAKARITQGANPLVNNPLTNGGATCTGSNVTVAASISLPTSGKILLAHAGTGASRLAMISATGYATTADCLATIAAPVATAMPTAMVRHPSGDILVAYGSATTASNYIYSYKVNETTNVINSATLAYFDPSIVMGVSAMSVDPDTGDVFVANGASTFNSIEKFTYSSTTQTLTRVGTAPHISPSVFTRCVSGLHVGP